MVQANDHRVLAAASEIARKKLANVTLLGNPDVVQAEANKLGLDVSGCNIHDHMVRWCVCRRTHTRVCVAS